MFNELYKMLLFVTEMYIISCYNMVINLLYGTTWCGFLEGFEMNGSVFLRCLIIGDTLRNVGEFDVDGHQHRLPSRPTESHERFLPKIQSSPNPNASRFVMGVFNAKVSFWGSLEPWNVVRKRQNGLRASTIVS